MSENTTKATEYLPNKPQLALNNENLNKVLADLEGLPGGANLNIATQDGVLIGTLTKDTDGFYKMQPAEDPWAEIDAQAGLIEEAIAALENKFIEAGVKGVDYGEVTITTQQQAASFQVQHNLGVAPKRIVLVPLSIDNKNYLPMVGIYRCEKTFTQYQSQYGGYMYAMALTGSPNVSWNGGETSADETNINFSAMNYTGVKFVGTYMWIAVA